MMCRPGGLRLTGIAIRLTGIAIRAALRRLLCAPGGWRTAEPAFECAREGFGGAKAHRQCNSQNLRAWLGCQSHCRDLDTTAAQIVAQCLAHPRGEESMEMERGEMRDMGQRVEIKRPFQMLINIVDHPVHPAVVFRAVMLRNHHPSPVFSPASTPPVARPCPTRPFPALRTRRIRRRCCLPAVRPARGVFRSRRAA